MRLFFVFLLSICFSVIYAQEITLDGFYYLNGELYSGTVTEEYPSGNIKLRLSVRNGELHGKSEYYYPDGKLD